MVARLLVARLATNISVALHQAKLDLTLTELMYCVLMDHNFATTNTDGGATR